MTFRHRPLVRTAPNGTRYATRSAFLNLPLPSEREP